MDETYRLLMKITYQLLFGIILSIGRNIQITGENYIYVSIYIYQLLFGIIFAIFLFSLGPSLIQLAKAGSVGTPALGRGQ